MTVDVRPVSELLATLTDSLTAATTAFPKDSASLFPQSQDGVEENKDGAGAKDGISLLDVKNDLLLSYLQHLVFLTLLRLRSGQESSEEEEEDVKAINDDVIRKLIELRVYLERGVRPLEGRLKYQIDRVLLAAEDDLVATSRKSGAAKQQSQSKPGTKKPGRKNVSFESGSEVEDGEDDEDHDSDEELVEDDEEESYRPNVSAVAAKSTDANNTRYRASSAATGKGRTSDGIYRPPRVNPVSMPTTGENPVTSSAARERAGRNRKSYLLDEYVSEEISSAPQAQPSIGSNNTILDRGRRSGISQSERDKQRERLEYEERSFTRLPLESKTERKKTKRAGQGWDREMFGGEDWTGLGGLGDSISRNVAGGRNGDRGGMNVLDRRRERSSLKRDRDEVGRSSAGMGDNFEKRRRIVQDRAERKRKK